MTAELQIGDNRVKVDRLWRSDGVRQRFEAESGLRDDTTAEYHERFIAWGLAEIARGDGQSQHPAPAEAARTGAAGGPSAGAREAEAKT